MNKNDIPEIFKSGYIPADHESSIYTLWEETGFFNPDVCIEKGHALPDAPTYSIVLPPPNVTGVLHIGHAAMLAIEDIVVRYNRMNGKRTLWIPGTDHAAIATQSKVEKILAKEKLRKHDLGQKSSSNELRPLLKNRVIRSFHKSKSWELLWIGHEKHLPLMRSEKLP